MKTSASALLLFSMFVFIGGVIAVISDISSKASTERIILTAFIGIGATLLLWVIADAVDLLGVIADNGKRSADALERRLNQPKLSATPRNTPSPSNDFPMSDRK